MTLSKPRLIGLLGLFLITPWFSGGKETLGLLLSFVALGLALFLIWRSDQPKLGGWVPRLMLVMLGWGALSRLWSPNYFQTDVWLVLWFVLVGAFVFGQWLRQSPERLQAWLRGYVAIAAIFSLYGMFLLVTESYNRLTSTFYWANPMAGFLLPAVFLSLFWWSEKGRKTDGVMALVLASSLLLTGSRAALLAGLLVGVGTLLVIRRKLRFWIQFVLVLAAAVALSMAVPQLRGFHFGSATTATVPVVSETSRFAEAVSGESVSVQDRVNYLKSSLQMWQAHPLNGTGAGTWPTVYPQYQLRVISAATNAHNWYAQTIVELGLVGGALLIAILIMVAFQIRRTVLKDAMVLPVAVGLLALLLHMGLDIDASYPVILALAGVLLGLLYTAPRKEKVILPGLLVVALVLALPVVSMYQSQVWRDRGDIEQDNHSYDKAAVDFDLAARGPVYDPDVITAKGINYYYLGATGVEPKNNALRAIQAALTAISADDRDSQHYFLMARANVLYEAYDLAEGDYRQALSRDKLNHPEYYVDLARLYIFQQRYADAKTLIDQVIDLYPDDVVSNRHLDQTIAPEIETAKALRIEIAAHL